MRARHKGHRANGTSARQFNSLVHKLIGINELIKAAEGRGPLFVDLETVRPAACADVELHGQLRELFRTLAHARKRNEPSNRRLSAEHLKGVMAISPRNKDHKTRTKSDFSDLAEKAIRVVATANDEGITETEFVVFLMHRVYLAFHPDAVAAASRGVKSYQLAVVFTQAIMALCIGSFLSTALLVYHYEHGLSPATTGLLLGIGEALGSLTLFVTNKGQEDNGSASGDSKTPSRFAILGSRPLHVPMVLLAVGACTALFGCSTLPGNSTYLLALAVAAQMIMSGFNDFSVSLLNELTAVTMTPKMFRIYQARGQWLRRLGNMLTGVTAPMMYGAAPWLPWLFYGGLVSCWAAMLWAIFYDRARIVAPHGNTGAVEAFAPFAGDKKWEELEIEHDAQQIDMSRNVGIEVLLCVAPHIPEKNVPFTAWGSLSLG